MAIDRAKIMTEAWVIVRRFKGNGEPLRSVLSRALRVVWDNVKVAARVASEVAARFARPARAAETIRREIYSFECKDTLRGNDWNTLRELNDELRRAAA
ncbi:hypothetical protein [Phaeovulum sp.]|uniref:hypothetical protein n=1 Tax=Phaeovulum sp. TaxID=2934796 RepID=UPI0035697022